VTKLGIVEKFRLDGRVTVVTGASSGLGVAFARAFAEAGSDVVLAARRVNKLQLTAELISDTGREPLVIATDIANPAQAQRMVDAAMSRFGRVDVLINNTGVGTARPAIRETPEESVKSSTSTSTAPTWPPRPVAGSCSRGPAIINISSILALTTAGLPQAA
jgi:NAD(P)-dependent dehydrogenase (short-subunit alcohol dehydrogenase family)